MQHVAGLLCDGGHLLREASCFIPFCKRGITADEDFQTGPPIRPHLQGARRRFETRPRASGEKTRERENVEPDEVLRVVWAQSQPIFQWSDRLPMVVLVKVGPEHWERYWAQILDRGRRRGDCTTTCSPLRWPDLF